MSICNVKKLKREKLYKHKYRKNILVNLIYVLAEIFLTDFKIKSNGCRINVIHVDGYVPVYLEVLRRYREWTIFDNVFWNQNYSELYH